MIRQTKMMINRVNKGESVRLAEKCRKKILKNEAN